MKINETCPLILEDLYEYDISKCYYTILKNCGYDLSNIESNNKEDRNIQIGLLQKGNKNLSIYLISETLKIIQNYFRINKILKDNIIIYQKDGCILSKKMESISLNIPIELRHRIIKLIISSDRNSFIYLDEKDKLIVKGIRNKPLDTEFYKLFFNLNYYSKRNIINSLESIRKSVFNSSNIKWFCTEVNKGIYSIQLKNKTRIKLNLSTLDIIDPNDIDKEFFWKTYMWPFCQSIILEYTN